MKAQPKGMVKDQNKTTEKENKLQFEHLSNDLNNIWVTPFMVLYNYII